MVDFALPRCQIGSGVRAVGVHEFPLSFEDQAMTVHATVFADQVQNALNHFDYDSALFLAERFAASFPENPRAIFLLGKVYLSCQRPRAAHKILAQQNYPASQYLFAQCCFELEEVEGLEETVRVLLEGIENEAPDIRSVDLGHAYCLLGKICRRKGKKDDAVRAFRRAIQENASLWAAYQNLCEIANRSPEDDIFPISSLPITASYLPSKRLNKKRSRDDAPRTKKIVREKSLANAENTDPSSEATQEASSEIVSELRECGEVYRAICRYDCRDAVERLAKLECTQPHSGWTLQQLAKAHYEMAKYVEAAQYFRLARDLEPWRLDGLDLFGSCLWHLREEVELAFLAQEMEALDSSASQTWCVLGNLHSLRQDHEQAIQCFERAINANKRQAYAYTLTGFEYKMKEDYESAISYFKKAILIDSRPFNPWFGLGEIFYQQENYKEAQYNYERALSINPHNPIVQFHLGTILQKCGDQRAITYYEQAVKLDPNNALYRFRYAHALALRHQYEDALKQLLPLKSFQQIESNVYLLMGRLYKELGDLTNALLAYTKARDHRSARQDLINEAIESLHIRDKTDITALFKHLV
ncbi:hypothetical protein DFS34DRAFT_346098 [Phlyctochytrium arcticum]|nr:hypothetical protein DFS34DRAFT_346098 [Phlyctochytrium arcticum]